MAEVVQTIAIENGDPYLEERAFRNCLGQFATGVTVVTASHGGRMTGVTVNSFSSLSLNPPLVLWSIARSSRSFALFEKADYFAINILSNDQMALSQNFCRSIEDKFAGVTWKPGVQGSPLLQGVVATFECRREGIFDGGDHVILTGLVERFTHRPGNPLIFLQGRYAVAQEHPTLKSSQVVPALFDTPSDGSPDLVTLLFWTNHLSSRGFEQHRQAEGLTFVESRIIYALYDRPPMTLDAIVQRTDITREVTKDAVADLGERGLISQHTGGKVDLTALGRQRRGAMVRRTATYCAETLGWASEETLNTVRHFLKEYAQRLELHDNSPSPSD